MVQINIFYSIRKDENNLPTLKLFADEECAKADQEFFNFWDIPCWGAFPLEVSGVAYIDAVVTREEYIKELESSKNLPKNLLHMLRR